MTFTLASCTRVAAGIAALVLAACSPVQTSSADRFSATGELVALSGGGAGAAKACFTCHGLDGLGNGADAPRLAGLNFGYLEAQLRAYADGRRQHPVMGWVAHHLSPVERKLVSAYYAEMAYVPEQLPQRPPPPLYLFGDPSRGLPACASCHGVLGQGLGPANPPLGGQPAAYLEHQIDKWRRGERRNDPLNVMLRISQLLTPAEAAYLSAYAADLPGGPPNQESPATFLEERRSDRRNDASAPPPRAAESGS